MSTYYSRELQKPLNVFLANPEHLMTLKVFCADKQTKQLTINLESIEDIEVMLDIVKEKLVKDLENRL